MGSMGPPRPGAAEGGGGGADGGRDPLASPPPTPGNPQAPGQAGFNPISALGPQGSTPNDAVRGLLEMSQQIDRGLVTLARMFPDASEEFDSARQLIQIGFTKVLGSAPGQQQAGPPSPGGQESAPALSPNNAGSQFPGGGFSSPGVDVR